MPRCSVTKAPKRRNSCSERWGVLGMAEPQRRVRRRGDPHPQPGDVAGLVRGQGKAQRRRIDDDETVAAIGGVHGQRPEPLDLERDTQPVGEAGQVLDEDAFRLAVPAFGADMDQPAGGFQNHLGLGLCHRQDAGIQQHRRHADRVGPGHRRGVLGLHDDEGSLGAGILRRHQKVHMAEDAAAGLVQHEVAQGLVPGDPAALRPDRVAGGRGDAADDDIADLAFRMGRDDVEGLRAAHAVLPSPASWATAAGPGRCARPRRNPPDCRSASAGRSGPGRNGRISRNWSSPCGPRAERPAR